MTPQPDFVFALAAIWLLFAAIRRYSPLFAAIRRYSLIFAAIRRYSAVILPLFAVILPLFAVILPFSERGRHFLRIL